MDEGVGEVEQSLVGLLEQIMAVPAAAEELRRLQDDLTRFRLHYKFAMDEVLTKVTILREEFEESHSYTPIEHVRTRLKSTESLLDKMQRIDCPPDLTEVRARIRDIAGLRITCAFESDVYWVARMLTTQTDITILETKDYIAAPKDNGYQSLHLILSVPVFLSDRTEEVPVEVQLRTIAMDFWASVEHRVHYKYDGDVPPELLERLTEAAHTAHALDQQMGALRAELRALSPDQRQLPG